MQFSLTSSHIQKEKEKGEMYFKNTFYLTLCVNSFNIKYM